MDREPRKHLPGITAKRRRKGVQGVHLNAGDSHAYRAYTRYAWDLCISTVTPDPLRGIRMKRIKRMRRKKGATFLTERYYLSRSLQPPFSGNKHQYVIPSSGYLLSHRLHRFSFVPRTPNLTTTYTTYTTSNGDTVAKGRVVLVVIVVVCNREKESGGRKKICVICVICVIISILPIG